MQFLTSNIVLNPLQGELLVQETIVTRSNVIRCK